MALARGVWKVEYKQRYEGDDSSVIAQSFEEYMAEHGYVKDDSTVPATYNKKDKSVCFMCAMKELDSELNTQDIYFKTTGYFMEQCDVCGEFIKDEVEV